MTRTINLQTATDAEINACFAEVVAKLERVWSYALPQRTLHCDVPDYLSSADAVLPWLNRQKRWICETFHGLSSVSIEPAWTKEGGYRETVSATDTTFPRAACIALLKAHGAEVVE